MLRLIRFRPIFPFLFLLTSASAQEETIQLHNMWQFREVGTDIWYPATVPGTVHTDLLASEIIPDPFYGQNEKAVKWVETEDWEYVTAFDLTADALQKDKIELVFEGLDTYADVYLNRIKILTANNMHRSWQVSVKPILHPGRNELRVHFHSSVKTGQKKLDAFPYLVPASNEPAEIGKQTSAFTRKAQYHYGWDWGPRLVTSGIWRPVYLRLWDWARITDSYFRQESQSSEIAEFTAEVEIESGYEQHLSADLLVNGALIQSLEAVALKKGKNKIRVPFSIADPELWWPNGMGSQTLYTIKIMIRKKNEIISEDTENIGIRTVKLITQQDSIGNAFFLEVNGHPVFMKGANVIPADFFNPHSAGKYEELIENAAAAHMNMIRVWGGGVYENDAFYSLCDEKGLLVWQDFMFSILMIPNDDQFVENIRLEAEENVKRLRNHPSIALWCGNNENLNGWFNWNWQESYKLSETDSLALWETYQNVFHQMLPDIIEENDPGTDYWSSSPSSSFGVLENETSGDRHDWSVWFGQKPTSQYEKNRGRFFSEYGLQSLPFYSTIQSMDSSQVFWWDTTTALRFRQRSFMPWIEPEFDGFDMISFYIRDLYGEPKNFRSFVLLSQYAQAEALQTAIESHRRKKPITMGSLYWNLNDVWPTVSWSSVDYSGKWKPAHFAVRETFKDVIVSIMAEEDSLEVFIVSDLMKPVIGTLEILIKSIDGTQIHRDISQVEIGKNSSRRMWKKSIDPLCGDYPKESVFIEASFFNADGVFDSALKTLVPVKSALWANPEISIRTVNKENRIDIYLKSGTLAKFVSLTADGIEGTFSDNYFDLPPGRDRVVTFHPEIPVQDISEHIQIQSLIDAVQP
ncbi:MAG: glycoside hydrolase family 2 protein [Candidatus Marinimicrobia bacterium]|nr:glycoside hydrolase family 2 protein [Candidatus Neomarinimicrobiota bacterium]